MSLETTIEEIKSTKKLANATEAEINKNPATATAQRGRRAAARERLRGLYLEYKKALKDSSVVIIATGSSADVFAQIASEEGGCYTYAAETLYRSIADAIEPRIYLKKTMSPAITDMIASVLQDKAIDLDVVSYPALVAKRGKLQRNVSSKEDFVAIIRDLLNEQVGAELVAMDALEKVASKAVNEEHSGKITPIVVYTKDHRLAGVLYKDFPRAFDRTILVQAGVIEDQQDTNSYFHKTENATEKAGVLGALTAVKNLITGGTATPAAQTPAAQTPRKPRASRKKATQETPTTTQENN